MDARAKIAIGVVGVAGVGIAGYIVYSAFRKQLPITYEAARVFGAAWDMPDELKTFADTLARSGAVPVQFGTPLESENLSLAQKPTSAGIRAIAAYVRGATGVVVGTARGAAVQTPARKADGTLRNRDVHEEGRAGDAMTGDVAQGTAIAEWLIRHARELGIQTVIWRRTVWFASRPSSRTAHSYGPYTGRSLHTDHVHFEINQQSAEDGARMRAILESLPLVPKV